MYRKIKKYAATFFTGPEFQLLDNDNDQAHRGNLTEVSGCVYGVAPYKNESKPNLLANGMNRALFSKTVRSHFGSMEFLLPIF
jgi:hypothetical protein